MADPAPPVRQGPRPAVPPWGWLRGLLMGLALVAALGPVGRVSAQDTDEAQVHAAYVINFLRYTRWPAPPEPGAPLVIGVIGPNETANALAALARRLGRVDGRDVRVRRLPLNAIAPDHDEAVAALAQEGEVQLVFVAASHASWNAAVVAANQGRPVLTVGAGAGFVAAGGMLELFEQDDHVYFRANEQAIAASAVSVSARVMLLSRPVPGS